MREYAEEHNMEYLLEEWDEEKNELTVDEVAAGDKNRYHWEKHYFDEEKDKWFDFEWTSAPYKRCYAKSMCPYLSSNAVWNGYNDLASVNPLLSKEWHPTKNGNLKPENISPNSSKKIWWMCQNCGNEYQATPASRNLRHTGCPKCAKDFQTSFPEYAIMYYLQKYIKNIKHSYKKFGFELDIYLPDLKIGIEYDGGYWHSSKVNKDLEKNKKCKELGIKLYRIRENLTSLNDYSIDILCNEKHDSLNQVIQKLITNIFNIYDKNINVDNDYFEIEKIRTVRKKENSLARLRPDLAEQWHPTKNGNLKPENFSIGSHQSVWWLLKYEDKTYGIFNFEWKTSIYNRAVKNTACPYLSGQKIYSGFNDLCTVAPNLAKQWHPIKNGDLNPTNFGIGSNKQVWWLLRYEDENLGVFNFEWKASITSRKLDGSDCPYFHGISVYQGYNDLASRNKKVANLWYYKKNKDLKPTDVSVHSGKEVYWKCSICGKIFKKRVNDMTRYNQTHCPHCKQLIPKL